MDERDVTTLALVLGIPLPEEWRDGVLANLQVCLGMGALVTAFEVGDEASVAGVFAP